jgi:hypothetical protein
MRLIIGQEKLYGKEYKHHLSIKRASWVARYKPFGNSVGQYFCAIHYFLVYVSHQTTVVAARVTPLHWSRQQSCVPHPDLMGSWICKSSQLERSANEKGAILIPATRLISTCLHIVNPAEIIDGVQAANIIEYVYKCK